VAAALGELADVVRSGGAMLVMTKALEEFVDCFDWNRVGPQQALLREIYRLVNQWLLQPHSNNVKLDLTGVQGAQPHPVPPYCGGGILVDLWAEELGRLLVAHDAYGGTAGYFAGVACDQAFSGGQLTTFPQGQARHFPLVGSKELPSLDDAFDWTLQADLHRRSVSVASAEKNCFVLGAVAIDPPGRGSHCKVRFRNRRSWTLDLNNDPVPDRFLKELVPITGYPYPVVKSALLNGAMPAKRFRLAKYVA